MVFIRCIIFSFGLLCFINSQASEWTTISFNQNFNFYYKNIDIENLKYLDSLLTAEFHEIEQKINYNTNQSIDIYLYEKMAYIHLKQNKQNPGEIIVSKPKVELTLYNSPEDLLIDFRFQVSKILVEEMIFGHSVEDKIKYANILRQPGWLLPGLYFYLSDQWSNNTDNTLRSFHESMGFSSIDLAPEKYHQLLSASFWKYLEHSYGTSSIYSLLYMIRLTRNFSSAISYTFKISLKQVFEEWNLFYTQAYQLDQRIPAPINGILLSKDDVLEILFESDTCYYSLENTLFGTVVFKNNVVDGSRKKIIKLSYDETPLSAFSGALFYHLNRIHLAVRGKSDMLIYDDLLSGNNHYAIPVVNPNYITSDSNYIYVTESNIFHSKVYQCKSNKLTTIISSDAFISSFDIRKNRFCVSESTLEGHNLFVGVQNSKRLIYSSKKPIEEAIFADDFTIIFNHGQNGIINSKMVSTKSCLIQSLTNFRYNILHHNFNESKFIEVVDKGSRLELFAVTKQLVKHYFVYDSIPNSSFEDIRLSKQNEIVNLMTHTYDSDSLAQVTYQMPISPLINYASSKLKNTVNSTSTINILPSKPDLNYYEFSKIKLNLTNNVFRNRKSVWYNSFEALMPSNLHLTLGASIKNKMSDNEISASYTGMIQPKSRDLILNTSVGSNQNVSINIMHRKRVIEDLNMNSSFTTDVVEVVSQSNVFSPSVSLYNGIQLRHDRNSPYYIMRESLDQPIEDRFSLSSFSELTQTKTYHKNYFENSLLVEPNFNLLRQSWNIAIRLKVDYEREFSPRLNLKTHLKAITSQGNSPNFYMIGGKSNDLQSKIMNQSFSDYNKPIFYESLYGVRGFSVNHRNGNTAVIFKSQLEFKLLQAFYKRPISNEFLSSVRFHLLADFGTAFYGRGIYAKQNMLGRSIITNSTNTMVVQVNAYRNPSIMSFGSGFSSSILGYKIQFDYAIGIDDNEILDGVIHIGLGKSF